MVERKIRVETPPVVLSRETWMLASSSLICQLQEEILQAQLNLKTAREAIDGALGAEDLGLRVIYLNKGGSLTFDIQEKDKLGFNTSKERK